MGSKKRKTAKQSPRPTGRDAEPLASPAASQRGRLLLLAVVFSLVAGVVGGGTAFLLRRWRPITLDAGTFTLQPSSNPSTATRPWPDDATVYAAYAGSDSCKECHWEAHEFWRKSHHGLAERNVDPTLDREAFDPPISFKHGTQHSEARVAGETFQVITQGPGGKVEPHDVKRVIGVSPLRQFLVAAPGGRMQALEASYDPLKKQWFNVYGDEDRKPGEWGHWTGRGMNWNSQCAACHNTRVRKNYDAAADRYDTKMAQMTVSCESCHGPMKSHVEWRRKYPDAIDEDPTIKPIDKQQMFEACGSCHARRRDLTGEFVPGDAFDDHYQLTIPDETDTFYPDGQVRDEDYEFAAFLGSRMHAAGVRCADCHHPHSSKPVLPGNLLCMRCHNGSFPNAPVIDEKAHTFHKPESAGSQCVNCHMPQTTYMQRHGRHDHGFTVPDPLLTKELGIPNACNRCHTDRQADWSLAAVDKWYGQRMQLPNRLAARTRTRAIAAARRGDDAARDPLLKIMVASDSAPYWKAVAAGLLGRWAGDPSVSQALSAVLKDPSPLVRSASLRGLQPLAEARRPDVLAAVTPLLSDPSRSVRLEAAWALRRDMNFDSPAGRELITSLDYDLDQPLGRMRRGALFASRGRFEAALREYLKAIAWDPHSPPFRYEAAVALSQLGRPQEAVTQLEEAIRQSPDNAEFHFALGLARNEVGQLDRAIGSFEEALRHDPKHARAWYNLGLARSAKGRPGEAAEALARAEQADPSDPTIAYARATVLLKLGRYDDAADAARRALALRPNYPEAANLLRVLSQRK